MANYQSFPIKFQIAMAGFLLGCQKLVDDYFAKHFPNQGGIVTAEYNKRYAKITKQDIFEGKTIEHSCSIYCFVDIQNGDIFKGTAKAPVKNGKRGNIYNNNFGLECMGWNGPKYLR